ncbi:MAG: hypothetical protein AAGG48_30065 [Planctomycetota bacterium]
MTLALVLVFCTTAQAQTDAQGPEVLSEALSEGFTAKDAGPLHELLRDWNSDSSAVTSDRLTKKPAFEQAVYSLYPAFFVPVASQVDAEYLTVQSTVEVRLVAGNLAAAYQKELETVGEHARSMTSISEITIRDFRPQLAVKGKEVLYLDDRRVHAILRFLTGKSIALDRYWDEPNGFYDFTDKYVERKRRLEYLNCVLGIVPGHWGTGWHLATHPEITCLVLASDLKTAVVYFRHGYGGGVALLSSKDNKWVVTHREKTWVE